MSAPVTPIDDWAIEHHPRLAKDIRIHVEQYVRNVTDQDELVRHIFISMRQADNDLVAKKIKQKAKDRDDESFLRNFFKEAKANKDKRVRLLNSAGYKRGLKGGENPFCPSTTEYDDFWDGVHDAREKRKKWKKGK